MGEQECSADKVPGTVVFVVKKYKQTFLPGFVLDSHPGPDPPVVTPWS